MNNHPPTDYHDTLIDRGLAELVGGETPPDLSERILAAHTATPEPVTLASAEQLPADTKHHARRWALFTAAACLFLSFGTWIFVSQFGRPRPDQSETLIAQVESPPELSRTAKEQNWKDTLDTGIGLRGLINDAKTPKSSDELMMTVTPHIIIQEEEEEEERLGIPTEEESERPGIAGDEGTNIIVDERNFDWPAPHSAPPEIEALFSKANKEKIEAEVNAAIRQRAASPPPEAVERYRQQQELASREQGEGQASVPLNKMKEMVEEFNDLRDQQRYSEMEAVAKKLYDTAPNEPVAQQVWENAKFIRRELLGKELTEQSEAGVQVTFMGQLQNLSKKRGEGAGDDFDDRLAATNTTPTDRLYRERETLGWHPSRDQYALIHENPFIKADGPDAVSTFSIDVDTASYANVRQFLEQSRRLPPADAVRIEELINYFPYDYAGPANTESFDDKPFAAHMEVAECPWNKEHRLARIAIKGKEIARDKRPQSNLVFLVDVSGSMNEPNKLPLLVEGMKMLTRELGENDRVAIVVYASSEGLALKSTRGDEQATILAALDQLRAGGSTAGGAGINLAYQIATDNFITDGTNRVILCTDGDFNVGVTDTAQLEQLASEKAKTGVFLTVLGFGRGNLNDAMMEGISGKGNGNYHYVDNLTEARKVLVEEMAGTLVTIAKDVKIQVEFNPAEVAGYRLIGYENRLLKTEDFNDDKKDAGEIGAGHTVTALYEIVPAGQEVGPPKADPLKYQQRPTSPVTEVEQDSQPLAGLVEVPSNPPPGTPRGQQSTKQRGGSERESAKPQASSKELLTLKLRYKLPDATQSTKLEFPITDKGASFAEASRDFQFAAAVASFGMLLRHSQHQGETSFDAVQEIAQSSLGNDPHNYRGEFLELVRIAKELTGGHTEDPSTTERP